MVPGSMGMKQLLVQVVNRFGYRRVLVATTLGLSLVTLLFYDYRSVGLVLRFAVRPVFTRDGQLDAFLLHEHPDAEDLPDNLASSGNSLLSMIMQLSMSIGVTIAGLLLDFWFTACQRRQRHHKTVFMYTA